MKEQLFLSIVINERERERENEAGNHLCSRNSRWRLLCNCCSDKEFLMKSGGCCSLSVVFGCQWLLPWTTQLKASFSSLKSLRVSFILKYMGCNLIFRGRSSSAKERTKDSLDWLSQEKSLLVMLIKGTLLYRKCRQDAWQEFTWVLSSSFF